MAQWKKGESGNPAGRPRAYFRIDKELEAKLAEVDERDYLKRTYGRIIVDRVVGLATRKIPSIRAISEIFDRVLGKPAQALTLDANVHVSREQRIAKIEELLTSLPQPKEKEADGPGNPRVN